MTTLDHAYIAECADHLIQTAVRIAKPEASAYGRDEVGEFTTLFDWANALMELLGDARLTRADVERIAELRKAGVPF